MSIKNEINKLTINEYIEKYKWKGIGSQDSPIIIEGSDDLPQYLFFKTEDIFIQLKNIDIGILVFENCHNIILEDSILSLLKIKSCSDILIKENLIRKIRILFGNKITIENNRFYTFSNIRSFTILMLFLALISGLIFFLSYIEIMYFIREVAFTFLALCSILFFIDIIEKRSKTFIGKRYKSNEFINFQKDKVNLNGKKK